MRDVIQVEYLLDNGDRRGDLVCDLTRFMDNYLIGRKKDIKYMCTYLHNDLGELSTENLLKIAFRYPGATRGSILLKRLDSHKFEIIGFGFNTDVCFGDVLSCYDKQLSNDIDSWIGKVLDFSKVTLVNNGLEFTY